MTIHIKTCVLIVAVSLSSTTLHAQETNLSAAIKYDETLLDQIMEERQLAQVNVQEFNEGSNRFTQQWTTFAAAATEQEAAIVVAQLYDQLDNMQYAAEQFKEASQRAERLSIRALGTLEGLPNKSVSFGELNGSTRRGIEVWGAEAARMADGDYSVTGSAFQMGLFTGHLQEMTQNAPTPGNIRSVSDALALSEHYSDEVRLASAAIAMTEALRHSLQGAVRTWARGQQIADFEIKTSEMANIASSIRGGALAHDRFRQDVPQRDRRTVGSSNNLFATDWLNQ